MNSSNVSLHGKHKVRIGDTEVEAKEWTLNLSHNYVDATLWADGNQRYIAGLTDIQGSFSGKLETDDLTDLGGDKVEVYLYAPAILPWYRAWWIRLRSKEWPDEVVAHGPSYVSTTITQMLGEDSALRVSGTFSQSGKWTINATRDRSWWGKWDRWRHR